MTSTEVEASDLALAAIPDYPTATLPSPMRTLVQTTGLPAALVAGAALAALAIAIGPNADIECTAAWRERAILWPVLVAPRGAGKSPSQELAIAPLRTHDERVFDCYRADLEAWRAARLPRGPKPVDPRLLIDDTTMEALVRRLDGRGALGVDADELQLLLRGLGQYKRGAGSDRGRLLSLWTGAPWRYDRVGDGGGIAIYIPKPTVVVCGGIQPPLHGLLGSEDDGLRPRWLPHLAAMPVDVSYTATAVNAGWGMLIASRLVSVREHKRTWTLSTSGRAAFQRVQARWKRMARGYENASTSAALVKADVHLLRIALCLAEAEKPAHGGDIDASIVDRGTVIVDFILDCWRALPEQGGMALSWKNEKLDTHVDRLADWLEQHGGRATKRDLSRSCAAGVRTAKDLDELLARYEARHPGTIEHVKPARGPRSTVVLAPKRRRVSHETVSADSLAVVPFPARSASAEYVSTQATHESVGPGNADSSLGAGLSADSFPRSGSHADNGVADSASTHITEPPRVSWRLGLLSLGPSV